MNKTNLLIDTGIFIAFLIAMVPDFSGINIHEWLSLAFATTIIVHLLLHWQWIIGVGAQFFKKLWHISRLKFVIDILLFVTFVTIMLSGILISKSILPTLGIQMGQTSIVWRLLHSASADFAVLLIGLHFALNWDWVVCMVKRYVITPLAQRIHPSRNAQPVMVSNDKKSN